MVQLTKKRIDVGQIGNPSTGDILYDGGVKLNEVIDSLYNTFGDERLYRSASLGANVQFLHATGYYQKKTRQEYAQAPIEMGSCHDIDTTAGAITVTLPNAKQGEGCYFINSNGSISPANPLIIRPQSGETILGAPADLTITAPYVRVIIWCTRIDGSEKFWSYGLSPMFGDSMLPVEKTLNINTSPTNVRICGKSEYAGVKLLLSAKTLDGTAFKTAEALLAVDAQTNNVYSTEYAVIKNTDSEIFDIRYFVGAGDIVYAEVRAKAGTARFSIKAIDTIKVGTAT